MRVCFRLLVALMGLVPVAALGQENGGQNLRADAEEIFALANQARAQAGVGRLQWDPALAEAALAHCRRMVQEGPIAHRYGGEADVSGRAKETGAHFSVIEENVAIGPSAAGVHDEWMHSQGHRENLLSPQVDRVGVAVIAARGVLYAVADYSHGVESLGSSQIEARVGELVRKNGAVTLRDPAAARQACAMDSGVPRGEATPRFIMRWQSGDLEQLPPQLVQKLKTGQYKQASVGSCNPQDVESFTAYRLAVLLY
jgi:Cysteine-rich secretory protein family